ncbi:MAG: hypothetical protein Q8R20_02160 [Nanoarchaeota archaeon]|nr:hypothetical protein [Nanoarchaeota archaeon]
MQKQCQNCKQYFQIEPDDLNFYKKMEAPPPTFCWLCRYQRRLMFLNERTLYKRACGLCGKDMVTIFSPDKPHTVYCGPCWYSDKWDPMDYGMEYDSTKNFFVQFKELLEKTPCMALTNDTPTLVNSDYVNHAGSAKNCYLVFSSDLCENVLYSKIVVNVKDSMDIVISGESELCYQNVNVGKSSRVLFSLDCQSCHDVYFSKGLAGCSNCFGCANLRGKRYCVWNVQYSKEEYEKKMREFRLDSYEKVQKLKKQAIEHWMKFPQKYMHGFQNTNATGDYVYFSKNAQNCYQARHLEDCKFCQNISMSPAKDCYDITEWGNGIELCYDTITTGEGTNNIKFCFGAWKSARNVEYSMCAITSKNIFGCANIRNKEYCVLNKRYEKEEYEALRKQIIEDMNKRPYIDEKERVFAYGEFFPYDLAPCDYNESGAQDHFPLNKEEVLKKGWRWHEAEPSKHKPTIQIYELPDSIKDAREDIVKEIIACGECQKPFKIIQQELGLLRRLNVPLPRKCFECRYQDLNKRVNKPQLFQRQCECAGSHDKKRIYKNTATHIHHGEEHCPNEFQTTYSSDRLEIIYCETCYQAEVA